MPPSIIESGDGGTACLAHTLGASKVQLKVRFAAHTFKRHPQSDIMWKPFKQ
jgi:hypothetical protein